MTPGIQGRVTSFLGLCLRAGRLTTGQEACVELIRQGGAAIAFVDADASPNTLKRVTDACHSHQTPLYMLSAGALGHAIGKPGRMVLALQPDGMADKLLTMLRSEPRC